MALVQNPAGTHLTGVTSITRAFATTPIVGNVAFAFAASWRTGGAPVASYTVTDNKVGNTYALAGTITVAEVRWSIYYAVINGTGASFTITITSPNNCNLSGAIAEFSGIDTVGLLDGAAVTATASSTTSSSGAKTPTQANDLFIGLTGYNSGTASTITPTGSLAQLVEVDEANGDQDFNASYLISTDSAAKTAQWTLAPSNTWGAVIVAFKATAGSTTPVGTVVMINHAARIRSYYW